MVYELSALLPGISASASVSLHTFSFMALYKFVFNFNFNFGSYRINYLSVGIGLQR